MITLFSGVNGGTIDPSVTSSLTRSHTTRLLRVAPSTREKKTSPDKHPPQPREEVEVRNNTLTIHLDALRIHHINSPTKPTTTLQAFGIKSSPTRARRLHVISCAHASCRFPPKHKQAVSHAEALIHHLTARTKMRVGG